MITITPAAVDMIRRSASEGNMTGLPMRIAAKRNPDGSIHYGMGFDENELEGDIHVKAGDLDVVIAESSQILLEGTPGFELAFAVGSVEEALRTTPALNPRVILLDIHLPGLSGIEGVGFILERFPDAVVLMLTVFEDETDVACALLRGGVVASNPLIPST